MRGARTSRYKCSSGCPRCSARAPWICTAASTTNWAVSVANSFAMALRPAIPVAPRSIAAAAE